VPRRAAGVERFRIGRAAAVGHGPFPRRRAFARRKVHAPQGLRQREESSSFPDRFRDDVGDLAGEVVDHLFHPNAEGPRPHAFGSGVKGDDPPRVEGIPAAPVFLQLLHLRVVDLEASPPPGVGADDAAEHKRPAGPVAVLHGGGPEGEPDSGEDAGRIPQRHLVDPSAPSDERRAAFEDCRREGFLLSRPEGGEGLKTRTIHVFARQEEERVTDGPDPQTGEGFGPFRPDPANPLNGVGEKGPFRRGGLPPVSRAPFFGLSARGLAAAARTPPKRLLDFVEKSQRRFNPSTFFAGVQAVEPPDGVAELLQAGCGRLGRPLRLDLAEPDRDRSLETGEGVDFRKIISGSELKGSSELFEGVRFRHRGWLSSPRGAGRARGPIAGRAPIQPGLQSGPENGKASIHPAGRRERRRRRPCILHRPIRTCRGRPAGEKRFARTAAR